MMVPNSGLQRAVSSRRMLAGLLSIAREFGFTDRVRLAQLIERFDDLIDRGDRAPVPFILALDAGSSNKHRASRRSWRPVTLDFRVGLRVLHRPGVA
jgi:hypothetical protein